MSNGTLSAPRKNSRDGHGDENTSLLASTPENTEVSTERHRDDAELEPAKNPHVHYDDHDNDDDEQQDVSKEPKILPIWTITCILSTAFAYGCIMTTLFLITLPIECDRIEQQHPSVPKSVALGCFVAIAGVTQLISPFVGMLSDTYRPPSHFQLGQRLPYLSLGAIFSVVGLLGEYTESHEKLWLRYGLFFFLHMIGLNITYSMMISLIPDQVPHEQTGTANGILAFLLVTGSLTGFGLFHLFFGGHIQNMYGLYVCIVVITTILTGLYAHDRDVSLFLERMEIINSQRQHNNQQNGEGLNRNQLRRRLILGPFALLRTMIYDPVVRLDSGALLATYTIDIKQHHDFFFVTVSRLCYYCGSSVQTFFLYFLHDIIRVKDNPESAVAELAVVSQIAGALICYPVGWISDRFCGGRRKPFVYLSCTLLGGVTLSMIYAQTMHQMTILCFILGIANGAYLTLETSLAVDTLPHTVTDGASGHNAQLLGLWGVAAFLGSSLGPLIGGPILYYVGSSGTVAGQDYSIHGYAVVLSLSAVYFLLSAVSLRWVKNATV